MGWRKHLAPFGIILISRIVEVVSRGGSISKRLGSFGNIYLVVASLSPFMSLIHKKIIDLSRDRALVVVSVL